MNKDQLKGSIKEAAGKVQETTGRMFGSKEQRLKGIKKQADGQAQKVAGNIREGAKDVGKK